MASVSLTHNVEESNVDYLLGGDVIYSVPYFQRSYTWAGKELKEIFDDINQIIDALENIHFLGAIILYERPTKAGQSNLYEIVDGQQRICTLTLFFCALAKVFCDLGKYEEAANLVGRYLLLGRRTGAVSNLKLHPCRDDRAQFRRIVEGVLQDEKLREALGNPEVRFLPDSGGDTGKMLSQYHRMIRQLQKEKDRGGYERLDDVYQNLVTRFTFVQIRLKDPTSSSRIFERLNYRGQKVTTGDLVRNEIFSRVADRQLEEVESVYNQFWKPFYDKFSDDTKAFEGYFFPYGLTRNPNVVKADVFGYLRELWVKEGLDPESIIDRLSEYQDAFLDLINDTNSLGLSPAVKEGFSRLHRSGCPASTYPFLMQLSNACKDGTVSEGDGVEILLVIDSFLTRRAVYGIEPTGLHAVFKKLWWDCKESPTPEKVSANIKAHKTVQWVSDEDFVAAIKERKLYGTAIAPYLIGEYERHLGGDTPSDTPQIEHVLPQKLTAEWAEKFGKEDHAAMVDILANLIPISPTHNKKLSTKPYKEKRQSYKMDSMYKTPRHLAKSFAAWGPNQVKKRAKTLADWSLERWPHS